MNSTQRPAALTDATSSFTVTLALAGMVTGLAIPLVFSSRQTPLPVRIAPHRVDLNVAGEAEMAMLPEVGPALAAAIIADRTVNGRFHSVDDLDRVRGVGPATLAALRPHAWVDGTVSPTDELRP